MSRSGTRPGPRSKPKLGQNFLIDPHASLAIADALGDLSQRTVVEIGPGAGAITELLLPRAQRLIAIELDRVLAQRLTEQHASTPSFEVISADVLSVNLHDLRADGPPLLIIGNLPYYITSDILLHLFRFHADVDRAVIMVQREVADRVAAHPGTRDYGVLSATAQLYARVERILTLPPEAFMPPPDVHSSVLRLTMQPQFAALGVEPDAFLGFVKKAFAQKRKTLASNLRAAGLASDIAQQALEAAGIPAMARAEELDLATMARLWKQLESR
ncbi:16S rRNA (adenine(1518)-N(6)/adenine(1519)-N(6))-dimethyltransferase RsmA [Silvibacterium dinghuense]|uniref:Ribosomal RNA small subunit methyltransferase A n=1 Tax=Silvibacterium dinghuense TaxID=1560006 RepID=A0A4Q1SDP3_9BACT|nr:16S rRNA (adenine(1518)-N(6)/adenine(1519)-N(6))-dimethyltransferase RsmA [Silvibacterium dinghuense]RXS95028.1 ribosomal RNA small subunit methyltransferase A [Silvibacterium dinghuense]GGH09989.1 ribosomal RNA small subunit methyltransferase A [Silvibacterium dinghuense]